MPPVRLPKGTLETETKRMAGWYVRVVRHCESSSCSNYRSLPRDGTPLYRSARRLPSCAIRLHPCLRFRRICCSFPWSHTMLGSRDDLGGLYLGPSEEFRLLVDHGRGGCMRLSVRPDLRGNWRLTSPALRSKETHLSHGKPLFLRPPSPRRKSQDFVPTMHHLSHQRQ